MSLLAFQREAQRASSHQGLKDSISLDTCACKVAKRLEAANESGRAGARQSGSDMTRGSPIGGHRSRGTAFNLAMEAAPYEPSSCAASPWSPQHAPMPPAPPPSRASATPRASARAAHRCHDVVVGIPAVAVAARTLRRATAGGTALLCGPLQQQQQKKKLLQGVSKIGSETVGPVARLD